MNVLIIATVAVDVAHIAVGNKSGAQGLAVGNVWAGEDLYSWSSLVSRVA